MRCIQKLLANHRPFSAMRIAHYAKASEMITELKQLSCILRDASVCQMLSQGLDLKYHEFKSLVFHHGLWGEEPDEATRQEVPGCRNAKQTRFPFTRGAVVGSWRVGWGNWVY